MPTLVLEDGTGLSNSNTYASLVEADAYFSSHPYYADAWDNLGTPDREANLILATSSLDALITWEGYINSSTQALDWPRTGVVDNEGRIIASDIVPKGVKVATMEMAMFSSRGDPYAPSSSTGLESLKIDVIELKFTGSTSITPVPAAALLALNGLGAYTYGSRIRKVLVG